MASAAPSPHVVIRASAGAGKTYQLVNHYLRHLHAGTAPDAILAVTFTRKAAGEILANLVQRLIKAVRDEAERAELGHALGGEPLTVTACHRLIDRLVGSLHRLSVGTIDSFFHRLARAFRWELDLPVDPVMADDRTPEAEALRQEVIGAVLADPAVGDLGRLFLAFHRARPARPVTQAFDDLIRDLHEVWRLAPDRKVWERLHVPARLSGDDLDRAVAALSGMEAQLPLTGAGTPHKNWRKTYHAALDAVRQGEWNLLLGNGLVARIIAEEDTYYRQEITAPWRDAFAALIRHATARVFELLLDEHLAAFDLLSRYDATYQRLRQGRRLLLFSDLTWTLARHLPALLRSGLTRVHHRLDTGIDHLLLDEFQDTSSLQWQVLEAFADDVVRHGRGDASLFVVGDVKQAIYGWRGGDAALFGAVEKRYRLTAADLATSYRSAPVVLDLVNAVFGAIGGNEGLPTEAADREAAGRFQADFVTHRAAPDLQDAAGYIQLRSSAAPGDRAGSEEGAEAEDEPQGPGVSTDEDLVATAQPSSHEVYVARLVADLHEAHPAGSIGVLVRTNAAAAHLLYELRQQRVGDRALEVSGEGGSFLSESPAVAAVLSALALADHPGDTASAYHVATSPLGAVMGLAPGARADAVADTSRRIRRDLVDLGYTGLLGQWARQLAAACDETDVRKLQQLVELSHRYETTPRPGDFVRFVEATPVEQATSAPIRVMTIHAAKGLEFDTVVLPELDKSLRNRFVALVEREEESGPPAAVLPVADKATRALSSRLQRAYAATRRRQRYEDLCLLYVAVTRARRAVHMIVRPRQAKRKPGLFAGILMWALAPGVELTEAGDQLLYQAGTPGWFHPSSKARTPRGGPAASPRGLDIRLASARPGARRRAWPGTSPSAREGGGRVSGTDLLGGAGGDARTRGLVVHEWFEQVGFPEEAGGVPADSELRALGRRTAPALADRELDRCLEAFRRALDEPGIREVLARQGARDLWRERAFALRDEGRLLQGRFDRVALWADRALLVDYKTDAGGVATQEIYRPQVDTYRGALCALLGLPAAAVEARLLYVTTGEVARM